jgi:glucokinase
VSTAATERWLIADIGGTNSRVGCWTRGRPHDQIEELELMQNERYGGIEDLLHAYLDRLQGEPPRAAGLAIAAPITGNRVDMLNIDWSFEQDRLAERFGLAELYVINDFEAIACALPSLRGEDCLEIGGGAGLPGRSLAVLGPGTGLGVAGLVISDAGYIPVSGEGGHMTLPAVNDEEMLIVSRVRDELGHCSAERILSGEGIARLHQGIHGGGRPKARDVSEAARNGDEAAMRTFNLFFDFLGTVASDVALVFGALSGVYIAGGIVPANLGLFRRSGFTERFVDKGRYRDYLAGIPLRLITAATPGLTGMAAFCDPDSRIRTQRTR